MNYAEGYEAEEPWKAGGAISPFPGEGNNTILAYSGESEISRFCRYVSSIHSWHAAPEKMQAHTEKGPASFWF